MRYKVKRKRLAHVARGLLTRGSSQGISQVVEKLKIFSTLQGSPPTDHDPGRGQLGTVAWTGLLRLPLRERGIVYLQMINVSRGGGHKRHRILDLPGGEKEMASMGVSSLDVIGSLVYGKLVDRTVMIVQGPSDRT